MKTLDYVAREMPYRTLAPAPTASNTSDEVGSVAFYSTQNADSEGEEGKFLVWTSGEIRRVLSEEAEPFMAAYGVKPGGNWEGRNILALQEAAPRMSRSVLTKVVRIGVQCLSTVALPN